MRMGKDLGFVIDQLAEFVSEQLLITPEGENCILEIPSHLIGATKDDEHALRILQALMAKFPMDQIFRIILKMQLWLSRIANSKVGGDNIVPEDIMKAMGADVTEFLYEEQSFAPEPKVPDDGEADSAFA